MMYLPASFRQEQLPVLHDFIHANPLGNVVSVGDGGMQVTPIPFLLERQGGAMGVLRGHMARANPHWRHVQQGQECVVLFQGHHGYITPNWFPGKADHHKVVPTWNYQMLTVRGVARIYDDAQELQGLLQALTEQHEAMRPHPWGMQDAPAEFIAAQMKAIVGLDITISALEGKWKLSQNKPDQDRQGIAMGLADPSDPHANPDLAAVIPV